MFRDTYKLPGHRTGAGRHGSYKVHWGCIYKRQTETLGYCVPKTRPPGALSPFSLEHIGELVAAGPRRWTGNGRGWRSQGGFPEFLLLYLPRTPSSLLLAKLSLLFRYSSTQFGSPIIWLLSAYRLPPFTLSKLFPHLLCPDPLLPLWTALQLDPPYLCSAWDPSLFSASLV